MAPDEPSGPRCRLASCGIPLPSAVGRNGLPRLYCKPSHRALAGLHRKLDSLAAAAGQPPRAPHRRTKPLTWEVVDLALVPREYLVLSASRIDKALRNGAGEIPGIRRKETP